MYAHQQSFCSRRVRHWLAAVATSLLSVAPGCDKVESIVDDVKSEIAGEPEAAAPVAAPSATPVIPVTTPVPQTPALPNPTQLVAEFKRLASHQIGDADLRKLVDVPEAAAQITAIDLRGNTDALTDAGLQLISEFPNLQALNAAGRKLSAELISAIGEKTSLRELDLTGSPIDPIIANSLSGLSHLQNIHLDETASGDSAAAAVSSLPIEVLSLNGTPLTDAGLQEIGKIKTLKELSVARTQVTGIGFRALKGANLVTLNASSTRFGVEGLVNLRGMKSLEVLHLFAAGVVEHTKAKVFTTMPNLRVLNLNSNQISSAGMHQLFKGLKNLEELYLQSTQVDDNGLAALVTCRNLKLVDVGRTGCTLLGAKALKAKLPECSVHFNGGSI
ncbi:hypothetical protein GC176_24455 [bacterium]|nr:hypothetical protein [bacterium]